MGLIPGTKVHSKSQWDGEQLPSHQECAQTLKCVFDDIFGNNAIELFERRTDVLFAAASDDASHAHGVSRGLGILIFVCKCERSESEHTETQHGHN